MSDTNRLDEYGFAGGATTPAPADPAAGTAADRASEAQRAAVPAGDLTGSISDGIDELTHAGDARSDDPR